MGKYEWDKLKHALGEKILDISIHKKSVQMFEIGFRESLGVSLKRLI